MNDTPVLLTVFVPQELAEAVVDLLLTRPDLAAGFSMSHIEGHGSAVRLVEEGERVRGYADRLRLDSFCNDRSVAGNILELLQGEFAGTNLFYWIMPVLEGGRLE